MTNKIPDNAEIEREFNRAKKIYCKLKSQLESEHLGKFVVIDCESGDYVVDPSETVAFRKAREKRKNARLVLLRIGSDHTYFVGGLR